MKLAYVAVFTPYEDGTGGFTVEFPDLPGCVTGGDDLTEALFMAEDVASGWILGELEAGNKPPAPSGIDAVPAQSGQFKSLIALDMDAYAEKYGEKAVKKTLTIPAWMNTFAESRHLSCSRLLQDAISELARA